MGWRSPEQRIEEGRQAGQVAALGTPMVVYCSIRDSMCPWSSCQPYFQAMADAGVPLPASYYGVLVLVLVLLLLPLLLVLVLAVVLVVVLVGVVVVIGGSR